MAQIYYTIDGGAQQTYSGPFTLSDDGQHTLVYWSVDRAGNAETTKSGAQAKPKSSNGETTQNTLTINIDQTAPTISGVPTTPANANGWYNGPVTIDFSASDDSSGVADFTQPVTLTGEGANQSAAGTATDKAGNTAGVTVSAINIDETAPTTTASVSTPPNVNGWNNTAVIVKLAAQDNHLSGVAATYYTLDGVQETYSGPFTVSAEGQHTLTYWSVDKAGNVEASESRSVNIDTTAPTLALPANITLEATGSVGAVVTYSASADDGSGSGVAVFNSGPESSSTFALGTTTVNVSATDAAGNTSSSSFTVTVQDTIVPVTTAPPSSALTSTYPAGVSVILSATDSGSGVATTYYQVDGGAQQTYSGSFTVSGAGTHNVSFYSVDAAGNAETPQSVSVVIAKATTSLGNLSVQQIALGTGTTTLSGRLTSDTLVPVGQSVSITLNGVTQSATVETDGTFSVNFTTSALGAGQYALTYSYSGDANFAAASGMGQLTVGYGTKLLFNNSKAVHAGAALPVKLELTNASGADISSSSILVTATSLMGPGGVTVPHSKGNANPNNVFRYDPSLGGYIFNLDTKGLTSGTYTLYYTAGNDPIPHSLTFVVG